MKRNCLSIVIAILLCTAICTSIRAATDSIPAYQLTVDELFRLGTENSLKLRSSRLNERLEAEQVKTARRNRLPQIGVGLAAGYMGQPIVFRRGLAEATQLEAPDWKHDYEAQIVQPLYQGGAVSLNIEREKAEHRIAEIVLEGNEAEMKLEYLRRYLDLFLLYKERDVYDRNIAEAERRQTDIHNMYEEGLVTSNDEIRSDLQLTQYRLDRRVTDDNIRVASTTLDILLGLDKGMVILPDTAILSRAAVPLQPFGFYMDEALRNYPGMKMARENVRLSQVEVALAKTDYLPKLNIVANYALTRPLSTTLEDKFLQNWDIGLSLSFNLSAFYQNKVKERKIGMKLSQAALEEAWQELSISINEAYSLHRQSVDRIQTLELAVEEAEENFRIVRNRYMSQLSILTDLLDAESVLLESELQLTSARVNAVYTYCQLLQACGRL